MTRNIKVIKDAFVRCQMKACRKWLRLYPEDEYGYRTIPLFNITPKKKEIFVCEDCFDTYQENKYN